MAAFTRLTLARQYLITSFPILVIGLLVIGIWVGNNIERGVINRVGNVTGLYVDSFVSSYLQSLVHTDTLDDASRARLDALLTQTSLGKKIVAFKIWNRNGQILYSTDPAIIGKRFPIGEGLAAALTGNVHSEISSLTEEENKFERKKWSRLIETYSPVHAHDLGNIIAVAEFYQTTEELTSEIRAAQLNSWLIVSGVMIVMYLLIFGLVQRGSRTIDEQRQELNKKVTELSALAVQNDQLHDKVRRAAARTTELNETFLRRIATDLHDGPGQDIGLALMRFESIADVCNNCPTWSGTQRSPQVDFRSIHSALQSALTDLRTISSGLQLPDIELLNANDVAERAVRDYERKTGVKVAHTIEGDTTKASLPVRITLYRLLQESLANGFRHGGGTNQRVDISTASDQISLTVSDAGPGFNPGNVPMNGHTGLSGMRERVEALGGSFQLAAAPGKGTVIRVILPLDLQ